MTVLVAGQNAALPDGPVEICVRGVVELGALFGIAVLPEGGRGWLSCVDDAGDWVSQRDAATFEVRLRRLPAGAQRVHVGIYARRGATIRGFLPASFDIAGHRIEVGSDDLGSTFLAFAELYQRNGAWKLRARSDWSVAGVRDFARRHGTTVPEDREPALRETGRGPFPRPSPGTWTGSAFLIGPQIAATNAHVVEGAGRIAAVGDAGAFDVESLVMDESADIALVRIRGCGSPPPVAFRPGFDLAPGEQVYSVGFPMSGFLGAGPQITSGMVAGGLGPANDTRLLQITAPIQPGSSGGPVFDWSGRLVGVAVASLSGAQNVNFAVRASLISYLAQSVGVDVSTADDPSPVAPDRILRACRGSIFKLECQSR